MGQWVTIVTNLLFAVWLRVCRWAGEQGSPQFSFTHVPEAEAHILAQELRVYLSFTTVWLLASLLSSPHNSQQLPLTVSAPLCPWIA